MNTELQELVTRHCDTLRADAGRLVDEVIRRGSARIAARDLVRMAHTLKGSSGTFGFSALSDAARSIEAALKQDRPDIDGLVDRLADLLEAAAAIRPDDSPLFHRREP